MPPSENEIKEQYSGTLIHDLTSTVETAEIRAFIARQGWKPDSLEQDKWRLDYKRGYMIMTLAEAYQFETENCA
jgi:HD superfamily phosphohydrolase YqeK